MAGITLENAEKQLAIWLKASEKAAERRGWSHGNNSLYSQEAAQIQEMIKYWEAQIQRLELESRNGGRGPRARGVIPL